jgi:molybdopterin biosynthesis enzyme MoaB
MDSPALLRVRVLGLGAPGGRTPPTVEEAVRGLWSRGGPVQVEAEGGIDDPRVAARTIRRWCDRERVEVVLTVGRGGPSAEDFAPEVCAALIDRPLPGIEERMYLSPPRTPENLLFRGRAGMRGGTLIVNLPDRAARARLIVGVLGPVVRHAVE